MKQSTLATGVRGVAWKRDAVRLAEKLAGFPREQLLTAATPLQPMRRLSGCLGGPEIWVKRDDLTGLTFGGNKVRQMEFFVGDALTKGADVFVAGGSYAQSNHARIASAAARAAGLEPVIVVRPGGLVRRSGGNALLVHLLCDDVRVCPELADAPSDRLAEVAARRNVFDRIAAEYRARGRKPYCLYGSSIPLGVMGYVAATIELQHQFDEAGIKPDWVVVTSLGSTQAGLELGTRILQLPWRVCGMAYMPTGGQGNNPIARLINEAAKLLEVAISVTPADLANRDEWSGPEYAASSMQSQEAMRLAAATEALILDPHYSAKGMAGLIGAIRSGLFRAGQTVVFIHTGGQPALFAYDEEPASDGD
jgi:1-aminocyclopropane-1-carboxylate deaminase/D-cysteine desulfhydrase-like pyridoxal-dependent ACC family enzyme